MRLIGITAIGKNRQIGLNNKLPWRNKRELYHFRNTTKDSILIMGRKTWESIPQKHWGWHGRKVIVISKSMKGGNKNVFYVSNPAEAIILAGFVRNTLQDVFICGGESIYKWFLPHIHELLVSEMDYDGDADSFFPEFDHLFENTAMSLYRSEDGDFKVKRYEKIY